MSLTVGTKKTSMQNNSSKRSEAYVFPKQLWIVVVVFILSFVIQHFNSICDGTLDIFHLYRQITVSELNKVKQTLIQEEQKAQFFFKLLKQQPQNLLGVLIKFDSFVVSSIRQLRLLLLLLRIDNCEYSTPVYK